MPEASAQRRPAPMWLLAMLAWIAASIGFERDRRRPPPGLDAAGEAHRLELDPLRMNERELRALAGIGFGRARAIVSERARWREEATVAEPTDRDPTRSLDWTEVPGIGPRTAAKIQSWMDAHGVVHGGSGEEAPSGAGTGAPAHLPRSEQRIGNVAR